MVLTGIKESLGDADQELRSFVAAQARVYDPGKKQRGEEFDNDAGSRASRHFRLLLLFLHAALDAAADLTAIFFTGLIPNLTVGRGQISLVEQWLRHPLSAAPPIASPQRHYLENLHAALQPLVNAGPPERDWLGLMRMLRNKAAHLGGPAFRYAVLSDNADIFHTFLPRRWPHMWEEAMQFGSPPPEGRAQPIRDYLLASLMHQDIISFASGLQTRVTDLVETMLRVVDAAYVAFANFEPNAAALAELQRNSKVYDFEFFRE